jgi:hypothetical protein
MLTQIWQFDKIAANRVFSFKNDLPVPDDELYEYSPRPATEIPPIQRHEFEYALLPCCNSPCPLSTFHDCVEPRCGDLALKRIPKRKRELELTVNTRELAWGLQAHYKPHVLLVFLYHVFFLLGPFAFWGWWQAAHPNDLQNAALPFTVVVTLISLFWSSTGILKNFR